MKRVTLAIVGLALIAGLSTAQPHPNGYATGQISFTKLPTDKFVSILDSSGNVVTSINAGLNNCHGLVMGPKNELLYASSYDGSIYKLDPVAGVNLGTVATIGAAIFIRGIAFDQNGDLFVGSADTNANDNIYKVDGGTQGVSTLYMLPGLDPGEGGVNINIDTAELLVLGDDFTSSTVTGTDYLWNMNRDGSGFTTLAAGINTTRFGHTQHIPTGDVYSGTGGSDYLAKTPAGGPLTTVWLTLANSSNAYCCRADRASAVNQTLITGLWGSTSNGNGVQKVDIATQTVTAINSTITSSIYDLEILYRKNVCSTATGTAGKWNIHIHIPEDATKKYNLVAGTSGVRPGVTFGTGRTAHLNPDVVTFVGLQFGLAPFLTIGNPVNPGQLRGTLDNAGKDTATLDLSTLPPGANGTKLWFLVLTEDTASPDGFATITDPHVIKIEGL